MDVIVYYSIIFDNWAYQHEPSWRIIDVYGKASREKPLGKHYNGGRYGMCCPNSQGYREYTRDQIEDFCSSYDFEGVFSI